MRRSGHCVLALFAGLSFFAGSALGDSSGVYFTVVAKDLHGPRGLLFLPSGDLLVAPTE